MTDERQEAIGELVTEWMLRARTNLVLAKLTDDERLARATPD